MIITLRVFSSLIDKVQIWQIKTEDVDLPPIIGSAIMRVACRGHARRRQLAALGDQLLTVLSLRSICSNGLPGRFYVFDQVPVLSGRMRTLNY